MSARFPVWMIASAAVSLFTAVGCGKKSPESTDTAMQSGSAMQSGTAMMMLPAVYTDTTAEFPRLCFADGQESLNDRCPVRKVKLNLRLPPLFVNGHPVGFC